MRTHRFVRFFHKNTYFCPKISDLYHMKRSKLKAWLLMSICVVMIIASVFPHHHHIKTSFCTQSDIELYTCPCGHTHSSQGTSQTCPNGCTMQFRCYIPQNKGQSVQPVYTFLPDLFDIPTNLSPTLPTPKKANFPLGYIEKLHSRHVSKGCALRAPPRV